VRLTKRTRYLAPIVAVFALASLSACAPATGAGGASNAGTGSSSAPNSSSGQSGNATDINACALVSASAASALMGQTFTGSSSQKLAPGQDSCTYATSDDSQALQVIVYQPSSGVTWSMMKAVQSQAGKVTPVSGVGDKAILGEIELDVQAGKHFVAIEGGPVNADASGAESLARTIVTALG
jgi:hypothetical protein